MDEASPFLSQFFYGIVKPFRKILPQIPFAIADKPGFVVGPADCKAEIWNVANGIAFGIFLIEP